MLRMELEITAAAAKSLQSCPALCDPIDGSPPGSPAPGILKARTLEWVAIFFSKAWKWKGKVKSLSRVWLSLTPWTAAYQAPLSMGISRQEYRSVLPLSSLNGIKFDKNKKCQSRTFNVFLLLKSIFELLIQLRSRRIHHCIGVYYIF